MDEAGEDQLEGNHAASAPERPPERRSVAEQSSRQVTAILEAGEEAAAEIKLRALRDAEALRERLLAEAKTEADGIRAEANADAKEIRREGHAAAATLREEAIAKLRDDVERMSARWGEELLACGRETIDAAEAAADEGQSAGSGLEQSLRHLQEIGREPLEPEHPGSVDPVRRSRY